MFGAGIFIILAMMYYMLARCKKPHLEEEPELK